MPTGADDWRDWRLEHAGLTWSVALPEDIEAIDALLDREEAKFGRQDRPNLFEPPVMITLVAKNEAGEIVDGLSIELVAEIGKLTTNREGFSAYPKLLPHIGGFLQARGVRVAQMAVASRRVPAMQPMLEEMGFRPVEPVLSMWVRKVRD